ncbi:polysaccharide deacetylase family protein [Aeoliella sp. ICT_H6.2]|uniref:Polysaccharide deacetylase family protein n=1 Tax=Aeoliella straminimaris TaxID=2954799 RepID=A0A9X2FE26_9BACT|nr:polysaccharide deacetylase family protein [Aeoliella straminimaris]MCO6047402.1 polysaccharide deacetylase family protein [Aeoliella straminimaris]
MMFARWFGSIAIAVLAASGLRFLAAVFAVGGHWAFGTGLLSIGSLACWSLLFGTMWLVCSRQKWWRKSLAALTGLAVVLFLVVVFPPYWLMSIVNHCSTARFCFDTEQTVVALTIDDAIDPETTSQILDVLEAHSVRATFFVMTDTIGDDESSRAVMQRIAADHEFGNHQTRDRPGWRMSREAFRADVRQAKDRLAEFGAVHWLRPGGGCFTPSMARTAKGEQLQLVLGSVYPWDSHQSSAEFSARFVRARVRPGSIIVLHDRGARGTRTVEVLQRVLPALAAEGYRVTTLSEVTEVPD